MPIWVIHLNRVKHWQKERFWVMIWSWYFLQMARRELVPMVWPWNKKLSVSAGALCLWNVQEPSVGGAKLSSTCVHRLVRMNDFLDVHVHVWRWSASKRMKNDRYSLPVPTHRPWLCPHPGRPVSCRPVPDPTLRWCRRHYPVPRHAAHRRWLVANQWLDSVRLWQTL